MPSSGKIRKNISHFWCKILEAEFFLKKACSSWEMVCQSLWETMWGVLLLPCLLKTLFSKKKSALVLRLLFQDFEKKIRITFSHVRKVRGKSPWELPNCPLFSHYFLQTDFSNSTKSIERLAEQSVANVTYECYENFTIYYPLYNNAKFWIEGVLLILVGTLGLFGNFLTLAVLSQSKKSTFNQLLIALSICDRYVFTLFKTSIFVQKWIQN